MHAPVFVRLFVLGPAWFALAIIAMGDDTLNDSHASAERAKEPARPPFALALHGGSGAMPSRLTPQRKASVEKSLANALTTGIQLLEGGGTSLDAVEQVVRYLEDDPQFNAGRGSVLTYDGQHELDASIMDGRNRACGAVAGVKSVKNPISLARLVMTKSRHVLLVADGADRFGSEMGVAQVEQDYFRTKRRFEQWQSARQLAQQADAPTRQGGDTVGCVALDRHGNLAAGTSTGGLVLKNFGRVGDSPIIGAGTYADNATCAVSCSGIGEQFIRNTVARDIAALVDYKDMSLQEAVAYVFENRLRSGDGGLIAVSHDGLIVLHFNTEGMYRAAGDSAGRFDVAIGK